MENTIRYLVEPLLTQFFLMDAICDGLLEESDRAQIYRELARVFCVPMDERAQAYYTLANTQEYRKITQMSDYERLCRAIEFAQVGGQQLQLSHEDQVILAQKREAMQLRQMLFQQNRNLTADTIADTLLSKAGSGNVDAMATLSFLEYHGICICKDQQEAVKRLRLCAKWNHLFGNLMGIAYDGENRAAYYNTLYTIMRSSNQREELHAICQNTRYAGRLEKDPVARILEKAFGLEIVQRDRYDRLFAQVAFSQMISAEDKERLLLNKKSEAVASLSEIPFDADRSQKLRFYKTTAEKLPLHRPEEMEFIACSLSPMLRGRAQLYQPLMVVGEDTYLADMYAKALENGFAKDGKVVRVDAAALTARDFLGTKEHFLLRGLSETRNSHTVFLIENCQQLEWQLCEELVKLLDYDYRHKFKLLEPTACMDLSDAVPVLLAVGRNDVVRKLAKVCDTLWTKPIDPAEKQTVINAMFRQRARSFGCAKVQLEEDCVAYLEPLGTGQIGRLIDGALKKAAYGNQTRITARELRALSDRQEVCTTKRQLGFWGGMSSEQN